MKKAIIAMLILLALCLAGSALAEGPVSVRFDDSGIGGEIAGVRFEDGRLLITQPGEYILSGELTNGQIAVDCAEDGRVTLVLNGVRVHCETGPALLIGECSPRLVITLAEETENTLSDGANLVFTYEDEPNGVIFSESDLTIRGGGSLTVVSGAMDGIVSKDDLRIEGGQITVQADRHGIRGKDSVEISGGTITVTAGTDGVKSTNKKDIDRGNVIITGGVILITCGDEPIEAENTCRIEDALVEFSVNK